MTPQPLAHIGFGQVRHTRLRPRRHAFTYDTYFLMLPMHALQDAAAMGSLAVNRPGLISFFESDHGDGRGPAQGGALGWLQDVLHQEGIDDADGEIWLHTYPRVLGYTFKPVSFWYCHRTDGNLRAIVVEVNNTLANGTAICWTSPATAKRWWLKNAFMSRRFAASKASTAFASCAPCKVGRSAP